MSKLLVVTGATGKQGGSVIDAVLSDKDISADWKIRAITRDVSKPEATALKDKGVEVVQADQDDRESLLAAFKGAHTVFAVTNYWATMSKDKETAQGIAMVDAAKAESVKHFIWSGLIDVTKATNGKLSKVYHFDGKAAVESHLASSGLRYTSFYAGFYMSNFLQRGPLKTLAIAKNSDGEYQLDLPCKSDALFPLYDVADTGMYVTPILADPEGYSGKVVYSGKYYTGQEVVDTVSKVCGGSGEGVFNTINMEEFKGKFPPQIPAFVAEEMAENMLLLDKEYGYYGGVELESHLKKAKGKLTTWEEYVGQHKGVFQGE